MDFTRLDYYDYYTNWSFWFNTLLLCVAIVMKIFTVFPTLTASLAMAACVNAALVGLMGAVVLCLHESVDRKTMLNNAIAHALPLFVAAVLLRRWPWAQPELTYTIAILLLFGLAYMGVPDSEGNNGLRKMARAYKFKRPLPWFIAMLMMGIFIAFMLQ